MIIRLFKGAELVEYEAYYAVWEGVVFKAVIYKKQERWHLEILRDPYGARKVEFKDWYTCFPAARYHMEHHYGRQNVEWRREYETD